MARASLIFLLVLLGLLSTSWARYHVEEPLRADSRRETEMERHEREERERSRGHSRRREDERGQLQIELGEAHEVLQSEGGRLRVWSEEIDALRNTHVGIAELELEQDGLLVPQYADADKIGYVLQGHGRMGAVVPGAQSEFRRTYVRQVQKGDVIALPKGTVYWWYNNGNERHRVLCAGDTTSGANPGRFHQFGLAGSKQSRFGSVLHGFSRETLATAWGVDQQTIESLLSRQNKAGIVKAKQKIDFPEIPDETERRREEEEEEENSFNHYRHSARSSYFEELKYSIRSERPDFFVENGGWLSIVNYNKLPALRQVGFSAIKVSLQKNAMAAPSFVRNAHQLIYITSGNGRVQVASGDGEQVFDEEVREGTVLAIPQFFPSLQIAGDQGLEWINLLTSDGPSSTFLAGRNSVYRGVPKQVIAAAFNVEEDTLKELGRDGEVIFPARSSGRERLGVAMMKKEEQQQPGRGEQERREQEQQRRREEEEQRRRREEQRRREEEERRRREEEERRRHEREREEEEQRKREKEEERRRREEEQRRRQEKREEEERRRREREELPAWALAALHQVL